MRPPGSGVALSCVFTNTKPAPEPPTVVVSSFVNVTFNGGLALL